MEPCERLAKLYDRLAAMAQHPTERGLDARDLSRLVDTYGADDVAWMLRVMADDAQQS